MLGFPSDAKGNDSKSRQHDGHNGTRAQKTLAFCALVPVSIMYTEINIARQAGRIFGKCVPWREGQWLQEPPSQRAPTSA